MKTLLEIKIAIKMKKIFFSSINQLQNEYLANWDAFFVINSKLFINQINNSKKNEKFFFYIKKYFY